jgi:transposase InsO family protein
VLEFVYQNEIKPLKRKRLPMLVSYLKAKSKLTPILRQSSDREIRVKIELVLLACKLGSVTEACARRGFSRKFFYKWYGRLLRSNWNARSLRECSRRPRKTHRLKTKRRVEERIHRLHGLGYGAPTIQAHLAREKVRLSQSTICHILRGRRKHVKRTRREKLKAHRRRYEIPIPGYRLQMDVKYVPEKVGDLKAYAYVIIDECTRMRFIRAYTAINPENTVHFLEQAKAFFPFALRTIQTDNGFEFTARLNPRIGSDYVHPVDEWCSRNKVLHRCIPPGEKELNGKVERSHRIDEQSFYWRAPTDSITHLNEEIEKWVKVYNHDRLHGGIAFTTPYEKLLERYQALRNQTPEGYDELFRLRFIKELPKRLEEYKDRVGMRSPFLSWAV